MSSAEAPWRAAPNPIHGCEWCSAGGVWMPLVGLGVRERVRRLGGAGGDFVDLEEVGRCTTHVHAAARAPGSSRADRGQRRCWRVWNSTRVAQASRCARRAQRAPGAARV
jgi:hypothetical protein